MYEVLDKVPSFGERLGLSLGGGLSQGIGSGIEYAQKLGLQKAKKDQELQLLKQYFPNAFKDKSSDLSGDLPKSQDSVDNLVGKNVNQNSGREIDEDSPEAEILKNHLFPEIAKAEREIKKQKRKEFESERSFHSARSEKILEEGDQRRRSLREKQAARKNLEMAIENMPGGFSKDYLAEITGYEPFRTSEGALFKTASKEYLLGNIKRAGARPNLWIEQQIGDMSAKIGRSKEANETFLASAKADEDIEQKELDLLGQLEDQYMQTLGYVPKTVAREVEKSLVPYAEKVQEKLSYELREIHERENPDSVSKLTKVPPGTPLTLEKAAAISDRAPGKSQEERDENAKKIAKKLGYQILSDEFYEGLL